jgi:hypothetical protein
MSPTRDANLDVSPEASDLPLIATNVLGQELDMFGTPLKGLAVRVNVGYTLGNTAVLTGTLNVIAHGASSSGVASSDPIIGQFDAPVTISSETAGYTFEKIFPITAPPNTRYVRLEYAIATLTASDSPSFSAVEAYVVENVGINWDRSVHFV